jgi:hypothetical protein
MYNLYPPFAELRFSPFHALDVLFRVFRVDQSQDHIFDDKPPLVVVQDPPDFLVVEDNKFVCILKSRQQ